jgi:hypothetical protein
MIGRNASVEIKVMTKAKQNSYCASEDILSPKSFAVSKSQGNAPSSTEASAGLCAKRPEKPPR